MVRVAHACSSLNWPYSSMAVTRCRHGEGDGPCMQQPESAPTAACTWLSRGVMRDACMEPACPMWSATELPSPDSPRTPTQPGTPAWCKKHASLLPCPALPASFPHMLMWLRLEGQPTACPARPASFLPASFLSSRAPLPPATAPG